MDKTPCFSWIRHLHSSMELLKSVFLAWNAHFYSFKYMWHGKLLVVDPLLRPVLAPHLEYFWVILPPLVKQTMLFGFTLQMVQRHHGRLSPTKQKKWAACFYVLLTLILCPKEFLECIPASVSLSEMEAFLFSSIIKMPACLWCLFSHFLTLLWTPFLCLLPPGPSVLLEFVTLGLSEGHQGLGLVWQNQTSALNYETLQRWGTLLLL